MFNIGDKVTTKKTGLPAVGKVVAIFDAQYYLASTRQNDVIPWSKIYPDWRNGITVLVKFNSPQRGCSFEEFIDLHPEIDEENRMGAYEMIFAVPMAMYPSEDLELIEAAVLA